MVTVNSGESPGATGTPAGDRSPSGELGAWDALVLATGVCDRLADMDSPEVLREVAQMLSPDVVAWAEFLLVDGGLQSAADAPWHRAGVAGRREPGADDGRGAGRPDPVQAVLDGAIEGPVELSLDGTPEGPTTGWLARHLHERIPANVRGGPVVVLPVPGRRRPVGLLACVPHVGTGLQGLGELGRSVLGLVVPRVGAAVENLRLVVRERRLAEMLQRAMLPDGAEVDGLDVWTYYAPAPGHAAVGGDWYDVLGEGPGSVAVVIGDVVGHDVEAAAAMGQLRSVVRSCASQMSLPGTVLDQVDAIATGMGVPRAASLVLAQLAEGPAGWTMTYSRAGHLPPLLVRDGDVTQLDGAGGAMVGFAGRAGEGRPSAVQALRPGDVVVLYTDGLIERRHRALRDGLGALMEVCARVGGLDAAGVGEELVSRLADSPEDDVAVLVVRVPGAQGQPDGEYQAADPGRRRWVLSSEPSSIGRARHAVLRTCAAWELPGAPAAELVVSELVANAVLHSWGHVVLRLLRTERGLRIEVEDLNPRPPVTVEGHPGRVGGFGMQIVGRLADWGWQPSGAGKVVWAQVRPQPLREGQVSGGGGQT